jgi:hypothetical protein
MSTEVKQSYFNQATQDKFLMVFDIPVILKDDQTQYNRKNSTVIPDSVQYSLFKTAIPDVTVKGVEVRNVGSTLYLSTHSKDSFPPTSVDFAVDNGYNNYWCIFKWINLLHDQKTGQYNSDNLPVDQSYSDYQTNITIFGLDEFGKKRIKWTFTKAFPTTLKGLTFDQQAEGDMRIISGFDFLFSQMHVELLSEELFKEHP